MPGNNGQRFSERSRGRTAKRINKEEFDAKHRQAKENGPAVEVKSTFAPDPPKATKSKKVVAKE